MRGSCIECLSRLLGSPTGSKEKIGSLPSQCVKTMWARWRNTLRWMFSMIHGKTWRIMDSWIHGSIESWIHGFMNSWIHELMDSWIHEFMDSWTHVFMNPSMHSKSSMWIQSRFKMESKRGQEAPPDPDWSHCARTQLSTWSKNWVT